MAKSSLVYQLKITLSDIKPPIWRIGDFADGMKADVASASVLLFDANHVFRDSPRVPHPRRRRAPAPGH